MGNDISSSIPPHPLSSSDCIVGGVIDLHRYMNDGNKSRRQNNNNILLNFLTQETINHTEPIVLPTKRKRTRRSIKKHTLWVRDGDNTLREFCSTDILWYLPHVGLRYIDRYRF